MDPAVATAKGWRCIDDEEDEEQDVCRICRNPGDANNPLRYPCACSGSMKFVHQNCLFQWLSYSNARQCEVCKHPFSLSPVYAENAPARLPFHEFVVGTAIKARRCRTLRLFPRLSFVLSVWLLAIPFITFWIWRFAFVRGFGEAQRLFVSHISTTAMLTDWLHGLLLSASLVFIFMGATSLWDYFTHLLELGRQEEREEEDEGERNGVPAARRPIREGNGEDAGDQGAAVAGLDDADGADDIPFYELVGMQGPVSRFIGNAFTVLASNVLFIGVVIFVPFTLGRVILYHMSWLFAAARGPAVTASMHFIDTGLSLENITLKSALTSVSTLTSEGNGLFDQLTDMMRVNGSELYGANNTLSVAADLMKGSVAGSSKLSDVTALTVGYMFIVFLVFLYLGIIALIRYAKGESLTIVETVLLRQLFAAMRLGIRGSFFVVVVLGVYPLMCGWWLDVCTVRMFGKTMSHRVQFLSVSPLASSLVHWVVGMMCELQICYFVCLLEEVLRPGVLCFLTDSQNDDATIRDLIDVPVHKLAQEVLLEYAGIGSLMVMLVFLPVQLAIWMAPSMFPLDISVSEPFGEIPAGMLLFQICIPFIIEHFQTTVKSLLCCWFTGVSWVLGLTDFLLPRPEENIGQDNENSEPGRQNRAQVLQVGGPDRAMAALPAAGNVNKGEEYEDDEEQSDSEYNFVVRIILLLLVAWVTLLLFNLALIVVPVSLGRALFSAVPILPITHGIKCNDLFAFFIGTYAFWTSISWARYAIEHVKSKRTSVMLNQIWKWCGIVFKSSVLLAIWVFIIPVLIGLLFELLVIVPMRVPVDESPVFLLYQDWAFGLIFLKIWTKLVMLDHMLPIVGHSWRAKFERVREDGFLRLQVLWALREILYPIVMKLLTALSVPYVLARGVFPMLGYPLVVNSAVYRFAWIGCLSVSLFCFCAKRCHVRVRKLHNSIRDNRYLIGLRLHNFGESCLPLNQNQSSEDAGDGDTGLRLRRAV